MKEGSGATESTACENIDASSMSSPNGIPRFNGTKESMERRLETTLSKSNGNPEPYPFLSLKPSGIPLPARRSATKASASASPSTPSSRLPDENTAIGPPRIQLRPCSPPPGYNPQGAIVGGDISVTSISVPSCLGAPEATNVTLRKFTPNLPETTGHSLMAPSCSQKP